MLLSCVFFCLFVHHSVSCHHWHCYYQLYSQCDTIFHLYNTQPLKILLIHNVKYKSTDEINVLLYAVLVNHVMMKWKSLICERSCKPIWWTTDVYVAHKHVHFSCISNAWWDALIISHNNVCDQSVSQSRLKATLEAIHYICWPCVQTAVKDNRLILFNTVQPDWPQPVTPVTVRVEWFLDEF